MEAFFSRVRDFFQPVLSKFLSPLSQLLSIPSFVVSDDKKAELTYWMGDDVSKLETVIGSGFSGGPLVQNRSVVGVNSGGNLESILITNALIQKINIPTYVGSLIMYGGSLALANSSLQYWVQMGAFILGMDSWPLSFVLQPALSYGLGFAINNNTMMVLCSISSAVLYTWGYPYFLNNCQWSTYAKITPDLLIGLKRV